MSIRTDSSAVAALLATFGARGVAPELLRPSVDRWQIRELAGGRVYVSRGQSAKFVSLVVEGELSVRAQKSEIAVVPRGGLFGLTSCIIRGGVHTHELVASRRVTLAALAAADLLALRADLGGPYDALLGLELRTLAERLASADERLSEIRVGAFPRPEPRQSSPIRELWRSLRSLGEAPPPIEPLLRALPGLRELDGALLAEIAAAFRPRSFAAKDIITPEGVRGDSMYLIARGQVDLLRQATTNAAVLMLANLRAGALFGLVSALSGQPRSASCVAADETRLYEMTGASHAALGAAAGRAWHESLAAVLNRQMREAYGSLAATLHAFTAGRDGPTPGSDASLVMFVPTKPGPPDDEST